MPTLWNRHHHLSPKDPNMLEARCAGRPSSSLAWIPLLAPVLLAAACGDSGGAKPDGGDAGPEPGTPQKLLILHTNDIHSHLMGFAPEADYTPASPNDDATRGGMARLASAIGAAKASAAADGTPVLLLDAGDFMMGTLFEFLATKASPELKLMQGLGYDATTIGNHELDWTPHGLAGILQAAVTNGAMFPILSSNMNFSATDPGDDDLKAIADMGVIQPKLIKMVGGLKVGFFGLLGANAAQVTPQKAPLTFDAIDVAAARMVKELRETDQVDLVIALSHSGIDHTGQGEDAVLASKVPGIDIIISGHTHETLDQPVKVGGTLIVTAGAYTGFLGEMSLTVTPSGTPGMPPVDVTVDDYKLLTIDDMITGDPTTQGAVDAYIGGFDAALMSSGLAYKAVVASTGGDLGLPARQEAPVGNLVTDAYVAIAAAVQPSDPPVLGVEANGQLRAPIIKGTTGKIWLADLFRVTPLGIGPDQIPGYPLVTFYLNAKDIRSGLELGGAPEVVSNDLFLQLSSKWKVTYDLSKPLFGRVTSVKLNDQALDLADTKTCYKVVTTNYVAGLLGVVEMQTSNLLKVQAKDQDCMTLIDPTTRFVDADPTAADVQELKNWQAVLKYTSKLPDADGDGIPDVPAPYTAPQGRITGIGQ
ncbi:MAG TPA: bifunctional UDP-sugar hydrolase/5'-nucleotidase [Polyangia bacterium]|jgi:5'-nucleotidase